MARVPLPAALRHRPLHPDPTEVRHGNLFRRGEEVMFIKFHYLNFIKFQLNFIKNIKTFHSKTRPLVVRQASGVIPGRARMLFKVSSQLLERSWCCLRV